MEENFTQPGNDVLEFFERAYRGYRRYWYPDLSENERYSIVLEHSQNWAALLKHIKTRSPGAALDLGAGEGTDAIKLALLGYEVDAVEGTTSGAEKISSFSRQAGVKVNTFHIDVYDFEPERSYDVVICSGLLHYINDKRSFLQKIRRAISPEGYCLLSLWSDHTPVPEDHRMIPAYSDCEKGAVWDFFSTDDWRVLYCQKQRGRLDAGFTPYASRFTENGIALMMVLWVLVFLSILSMNFLRSTRWVTGSTHNLKEETLAYYQALSGYHEALHYIAADKDLTVDFLDEEVNFWIDNETIPVTGKRETDDLELEIRITDENARININFAQQDRVRKLLERVGVKEDEIIVIMDSVLDWKDLDKEHHLSGAEDDYYESLDEPYTAKNGLFDVPEELALEPSKNLILVYGDGSTRVYQITQVLSYQALTPDSPYSNFVDLSDPTSTLSVEQVFYKIYASGNPLVLQTCIAKDGDPNWGRLFVIAYPVAKAHHRGTSFLH